MSFEPLRKERFLSLVTRRRNGAEVATPMWFIVEGEKIYMRTGAQSGKVKRVRNDGRVSIAVCTGAGRVIGPRVEAVAVVAGEQMVEPVNRGLKQKYGVMKWVVDLVNRLRGLREVVVLELRPPGP